MQNHLNSKHDSLSFDRESFLEKLECDDDEERRQGYSAFLDEILDVESSNVEWSELYKENESIFFFRLKAVWMKRGLAKGMGLPVTESIWDLIIEYSERENETSTPVEFFTVETKSYKDFLDGLLGSIYSTGSANKSFATLWGSVHLYEYLLENDLISEETFTKFLTATITLKGGYLYSIISKIRAFVLSWHLSCLLFHSLSF